MRTIQYQVRAPKGDHTVAKFDHEDRAKDFVKDRSPVVKLRLVRVITTEHELAV